MRRLLTVLSLGTLVGCLPPVVSPPTSSSPATVATPQPTATWRASPQPLRGLVSTLSHGAAEAQAIAIDGRDHMFVLGPRGVYEVEPNGRTRIIGAPVWGLELSDEARRTQLAEPAAIAVGPDGTVFVPGSKRLYRIQPDGTLTSQPGPTTTYQLQSAVVDHRGTLYIALRSENYIWRLNADGSSGVFAGSPSRPSADSPPLVDGLGQEAKFSQPTDLAVDDQNNLYVADRGHGAIRKITPDGVVSTVFGQPRPPAPPSPLPDGTTPSPAASLPPFVGVETVTLAPQGGFYVTSVNRLLHIGPDGSVKLVAGAEVRCEQSGFLWQTPNPSPSPVCFAEGQGADARFDRPQDMAIDSQGRLFVVDSGNRRIRRVE